MLIDSHCHLNLLDLSEFDEQIDPILNAAAAQDVQHFLSVCVELGDFPILCDLANRYANVSISVGVHPNHEVKTEPTSSLLSELALSHSACIAIGETGLDYYREESVESQANQQERFRQHIRAALATQKPLIIHTRQAAEDTLAIMKQEQAQDIGGVMHCFSENWEIAQRALDLNFYISMSGIVSFKNAHVLHDVAKKVPLDRLLIETDSPYLAPVPFRGKQNQPAYVKYVALALSELRNESFEEIADASTENFQRCFKTCVISS